MKPFLHTPTSSSVRSDQKSAPPIPRMVWIIGAVMFCANLASVIVYAYGGVYLKEVLHFRNENIGLVEGFAEGISCIMKLVSGVLSDAFHRRKALIIIGYGLIVCARYTLAVFSRLPIVYIGARLTERIGNGIQAAPRSALVGDIAPHKRIGACYGLKRSLATLGSVLGAGVAVLIMFLTDNNYQFLFAFTAVPVTIGFILLIFNVKEPQHLKHAAVLSGIPSHAPKYRPTFQLSNLKFLGSTFWKLMLVNFIFLLARMGETFLTLFGRSLQIRTEHVAFIMVVFNVAWCLSSYPIGYIADKMSRYWLLLLGMAALVFADVVLASAHSLPMFFLGVLLWGVQYGTTQNIFLSLINEVVPENLRGSGLGIYWITCAIATITCDWTMGRISDYYDSLRYAYVASGIISIFGLMSLIFIMGYKIRGKKSKKA